MTARIRVYDDGYGRLRLRWFCDDSGLWHEILADFKDTFRIHGERSFNSSTRAWSVPLWCRHRLEEWADYWFDADAQQWDEDEPDGRTYGRTYSNSSGGAYGRYGGSPSSTGTLERAYAELHLLPGAPAWAAEAVYRAAIKVHHPDVGGEGQTMTAINLAMELIREHTERKAS